MSCRQCDVIGCSEVAAWERAGQIDGCLEDFLCNPCRLRLARQHPEQAALYTVCNAELATPLEHPAYRSAKPKSGDEIIVIL